MIIAIMACFGLAVVLNYYSHILSTRSMEKILRRINAHKKNGDTFNATKTRIGNFTFTSGSTSNGDSFNATEYNFDNDYYDSDSLFDF